MKTKYILTAAFAVLFTAVLGCSTPIGKRLNRLESGMSQAQAKKILGDDYTVKAARTDANGATLLLWEDRDTKTEESYGIYFKDGLLAQ